uniref:Integrin_alpha2 domain-containing protein n=1 Tax=Bursaphelenchus xylophilus TaxID=6326 RepID=A0A1I7SJ92_BURXY
MRISKAWPKTISLYITVFVILEVLEQTYSLSMLNLKFTHQFRPNHCKARNCRTRICVKQFQHNFVPNQQCLFGEGTVDWTWVEEGEPLSIKVAINNTRNSVTISLETYLFNITTLERMDTDKNGNQLTGK